MRIEEGVGWVQPEDVAHVSGDDTAVAHGGSRVAGMGCDDALHAPDDPLAELWRRHLLEQFVDVLGRVVGLFPRDVAGLADVEFGDVVDDGWGEAVQFGQRRGGLDGSEHGTHIQVVDVGIEQIAGGRTRLAVAQVGEPGVGARGVVIDTFRTAMAHENQIHAVAG